MKILNNAVKALELMKKHIYSSVVSVIVDLFTIFLFGVIFQLYHESVGGRIGRVLINLINPAGQVQSDIVGLIVATVLFYLVLYIVWTGLQSVSWWKAFGISGSKISYKKLLKRFAKWNILWIIIAAVINTLHDALSIVNSLANELFFNQAFVDWFFVVVGVVLAYFLLVSYINRKPFVIGVKKANIIIPACLFIGLSMTVVHHMMVFGSIIHPMFNIVMAVVLFLPAVTWAKIYLIINIKEV